MSGNESKNTEKGIYLDNAATTRVDDRVIRAMVDCYSACYGNASSLHHFGTQAREKLRVARKKIADCINAEPAEVFFTSGGSESNNWALKGVAYANRHKGRSIIISTIEHDCIINTCCDLESRGFRIIRVPVDQEGTIDVTYLKRAIDADTILVSVMHANNEIGTIQPIDEIGEICRQQNILFHADACQSFGKIPVSVNTHKADLITINAHKIYGPKGTGALYIRKGTQIIPLLHGGGQEGGLRSSTENVPGIAGFAVAAELCLESLQSENLRLRKLRKELTDFLFTGFDNVYLNGHPENHLPGHLNFSFHGLEGEAIRLLLLLDEAGIAVSAGSACSSNDKGNQSSHVLKAIGRNALEARGGIRVSMGRFTTADQTGQFIRILAKTIQSLNPIYL